LENDFTEGGYKSLSLQPVLILGKHSGHFNNVYIENLGAIKVMRHLKLLLVLLILAALVASVYIPVGTSYGATGTSVIEVSSSSVTIVEGGSTAINYTVKLNSGTTWGTDLAYKSASGISAAFSVPSGDPTFSGKMTVSVASSVKVGTYTLSLYATGDDPANDTNISINVTAATVSGTSVIEVSSPLSITAGGSASENYTVKLNSGTTGTTNLDYKSESGITAVFSTPSGNPTFSGKMTVSVASSVKVGTYTLSLYATGDDPANDTNVSINVIASSVSKEITLHSEKTIEVNANSTSSYSISVSTPGSYNLTVIISPGTYALINKTMESRYNFTLATFNQNSTFPSPSTNYTVLFFFVFEVNGVVSKDIMFVNSSGDARPVTTEINSPFNWTSWTFLGGELINNGTVYNYTGGSYVFSNSWTFNSTSHELVNTQFFSPVPWVFVEPVTKKVTKPTQSYLSPTTYIVIIVIVIILIGVGVAVGIRSARKKGQK
jgi:hypothetical protein